jgi:uncharacterized repeat protein (TIGR02543 family)
VTLGTNPNYAITTADGTFTINQRAITLTANDDSKTYGDSDPASFTASVTTGSVVSGDTLDYTVARETGENAGTYAIKVTLGTNPNYAITTVGGTFTITAAPVTRYTVTFVDYDGTVLDTDTVISGGDAAPPADPTRDGYDFSGWNGTYTNVTSNVTVTATYTPIAYEYTVTYVDTDGVALADAKVGTADFGTDVTETAIDIEGYDPEEIDQTITIGTDGNEIVFVYDATEVPLASSAWALINLLLMLLTAAISIGLLITYFRKKNEDEEVKRKGVFRISSLVPAIVAIVVFILTENMKLPMQMVDKWTIWMAIIAAIQVVVMVLAKRKSEEKQEENLA